MNNAERVFKALASRRRLAMLLYLRRTKSATLAEIAEELRLSYKATAWNLRRLTVADVVETDRHGLFVFYSLNATSMRIQLLMRTILTFVRKLE